MWNPVRWKKIGKKIVVWKMVVWKKDGCLYRKWLFIRKMAVCKEEGFF